MRPPALSLCLIVSACTAGDPATEPGTSGATGATNTTGTDATTPSSETASTALDSAGGELSTSSGTSGDPVAPDRVHGVTLDAVEPLPDIVEALAGLSRRPTTRVVFDEFVPAADYVDAVTEIATVSGVMGELVDSFYVEQYAVAAYEARTIEYLDAMAEVVDIWEIGNEINGEWVCDTEANACTPEQTAEVVAKISAAYAQVRQRGEAAALTLYYNEDCWSQPEHEMFTWASANVPAELRDGLDFVWVSYYEDDCNGLQPDWPMVFAELAELFPNARLGIGECGTTMDAEKAAYVERYYGMTLDEPRFVGGFFWWYFRQDMVPKSQPLWQTLDAALQ